MPGDISNVGHSTVSPHNQNSGEGNNAVAENGLAKNIKKIWNPDNQPYWVHQPSTATDPGSVPKNLSELLANPHDAHDENWEEGGASLHQMTLLAEPAPALPGLKKALSDALLYGAQLLTGHANAKLMTGPGLMNMEQNASHSTSLQENPSPAHSATGGQSPSYASAQLVTKLSDRFNPAINTFTGALRWIDEKLTFPGAEAIKSPPPATGPQAEFSAKELRLLKGLATDTGGRNTISALNNQKNIYGNGTIYTISDSAGDLSKDTTDTVKMAGMYIPVTTDTLPGHGLRYSIMAEGHKYPLQWSEAQGWTFDRQNPTYSTLDRLPEQNAAVTQFLRTRFNPAINTEDLLYKTAVYVSSQFTSKEDDTRCQDRKREIARTILGASGYYGGGENENISNGQTDRILNSWFIENLFHDSLNEYVADAARGDSDMNLGKLRGELSLASLQKKGIFSLDKVPVTYRSEFDAYLEARIRDAFPLLHITGNDGLSLQDYEFAFLYAGSKWLFDTSNATHLEEYSHNEIQEIGLNLWGDAQENGIPSDRLPLLELPSMIKNSGPVSTFSERLNAVSLYAENIKLYNTAMQELQDLFGTYKHKLSEWMRRGDLADKVIDKCKPEYLRHKRATDGKIPQHEVNEWEARKQAYLNGLAKPCAGAPESLNDEYTRLTGEVADSYKNIDSILLGAALGNVRDNDKDFISHSDAFIRPVNYALGGYSMSAGPAGVGVNWKNIPLKKDVDLFAVELKGEKRFYAFKNDNAGDSFGNYSIVNLGDGSSVAPFCENGLLELDLSKGYTINGKELKIQNAPHPFTLDITPDNRNEICTGDKADKLVDYIAGKHRDHLFSKMYEHGYDKSNIEKLWGFIKSIVPGLNCYSLVKENIEHPSTDNLAGAISGCLWDTVALLPVAGGITRLSQKFGMSAVQGIMKSAGRNIISSAARGASLPSLGELKALSVSALRALDPGIEVTGRLGTWSVKRISDRLMRQGNKVLAGKITKNLNAKDLQPRDVPSGTMILPLRSSGVGLPVKRMPQKNGRDIYVAVNPETGELGGRKYGVYDGELVDADFIPPVVGGMNIGKPVPAELKNHVDSIKEYTKNKIESGCAIPVSSRAKRCIPPELPQALKNLPPEMIEKVFSYLNLEEVSILARADAKFEYEAVKMMNSLYSEETGFSKIIAYAMDRDNVDILHFLRHRDIREEFVFWDGVSLVSAIQSKKTSIINYLLSVDGVKDQLFKRDKFYYSAMTYAKNCMGDELLSKLVAVLSDDINGTMHNGMTPLMSAATELFEDSLEKILKVPGVDVNKADANGKTALIHAAHTGVYFNVKTMLRDPRVNVNLRDNNGETALMHAVRSRNAFIVSRILSNSRVDSSITNNLGQTAYDIAVIENDPFVLYKFTTGGSPGSSRAGSDTDSLDIDLNDFNL